MQYFVLGESEQREEESIDEDFQCFRTKEGSIYSTKMEKSRELIKN